MFCFVFRFGLLESGAVNTTHLIGVSFKSLFALFIITAPLHSISLCHLFVEETSLFFRIAHILDLADYICRCCLTGSSVFPISSNSVDVEPWLDYYFISISIWKNNFIVPVYFLFLIIIRRHILFGCPTF